MMKKSELLVIGDRIHLSLVRKEPISSLCCSSYFHLCKISSIRPYLSDASTTKLVSSLILSRLDYCIWTLSGLPSSSLKWLQKVQNNAARLVLHKRKSDHVTPLLKQLHWLPIEARIHYKTATLVFRHFENSLAPYLFQLLQIYQPTQTLRSSNEKTPESSPNQPKICRKQIFLL